VSEQPKITVYSTPSCAYCGAARMLLTKKALEFEDIIITDDVQKQEEMRARRGGRTVPQIFLGDTPIGGFDELYALEKSGELDKLLAG